MPVRIQELSTAVPRAGGDIFLSVQTRRGGRVKGEATAAGHEAEIELTGWQWGLATGTAIGSTQTTARRSYTALTVFKRIDAATTSLMSAAASNDEVKEAVLTMRRAGGEQDDFFIVTLNNARILSMQHASDAAGETLETVAIAFVKVQVEYRPQKSTGIKAGSQIFNDELQASS